MKKIVVLTGLKGAGKDETAKVLIKYFGYKKIAFADLLKDVTAELFGWERDGLEGTTPQWREWRETSSEYGFTPREALQKLGTDLLRNQLYADIWVDGVIRKIKNSKHKKWVITDCRFPNEINAFKDTMEDWDVHFWRIEREPRPDWWDKAERFNLRAEKTKSGKYPTISGVHSSECAWQGLDRPEVVVYNHGTLKDLKEKVIEFAGKFLGEKMIHILFKF